ncbi:hypothetical protein RPM58_003026 [Escherichia coli]|nr:hypothetical protein [Escherichia coli]
MNKGSMTTNHPANGPVSLVRLHQISEILRKAAAQSDGGNLGYAMADAVKVIDWVIDWVIAEFEEQDNPRPVMAVKGELGFIDNLEKIIEERDEDIDIGQLGRSNYDALMLASLDAFRASLPETVGPNELPAYKIKRFGEFVANGLAVDGEELDISIKWFNFDHGTTPEPDHRRAFVEKYALQAIINTLQQRCDGLSDTPTPVIWPAAPQQEVKS